MTPEEEFYTPDPDAAWYYKINPCHCDHIDALNGVQQFLELFAPYCQCCAGTRVLVLAIAVVLALMTGTVFTVAAFVLLGIVLFAVVLDVCTRVKEERLRRSLYDNSDEG